MLPRYHYRYKYKCAGPGTRAAEGTDLDQVLSCLRDYSSRGPPLGALFPEGSSACSPLPTLPGSATVVLASCRGGLRKYHLFANSQVRSRKYKRTKSHFEPIAVVVCSVAVSDSHCLRSPVASFRLTIFVFRLIIFEFFFLSFVFECRVFCSPVFCLPCNYLFLFLVYVWVASLFFALYMCQVPAQSEHIR